VSQFSEDTEQQSGVTFFVSTITFGKVSFFATVAFFLSTILQKI
jgi:hypothetical protein